MSDTIILFASMESVLIHAVLAPLDLLDPPDQKDLSDDFIQLDDGWMIEHVSGGGEADRVYLAPPLSGRSKTLQHGEKLVFQRSFAASSERPIEISQKLVHALDLHFVAERNAYCRLDEDGDIEDVITITEANHDGWFQSSSTVVTIRAGEFVEYMRLAGMGMVVFFDFTRVRWGAFSGWSGQKHFDHKGRDLFYNGGVMAGHGSYVNGRMIVRPAISYEEVVAEHMEKRNPSNRTYAKFKSINLKTGERMEVSCAAEALSNYFQKDSPLPLEMSPVFFKSEVLHRYKADPEKYEIRDRSIYCRGTWSLQTYDINDEGQVHTYLVYLRQLPYREQLYWQSFNEWPKGGLSKRAITTDFKGEFYGEYDPVNSLKRKVLGLDKRKPAWWIPRGEDLAKAVHSPATTSSEEWANEILALDHLLLEGFRDKGLKAVLTGLGRLLEPEWRSFKLLEECMVGKGVDAEDAKAAVASLRTLREMRNVLKGHAASTKRRELEKQAKTDHRSFRSQFTALAAECDAAFALIIESLLGEPPDDSW
jgi:hypothetical protein